LSMVAADTKAYSCSVLKSDAQKTNRQDPKPTQASPAG